MATETARRKDRRLNEHGGSIRLTRRGTLKFLQVLENPPKPNAALKKAVADAKKNGLLSN